LQYIDEAALDDQSSQSDEQALDPESEEEEDCDYEGVEASDEAMANFTAAGHVIRRLLDKSKNSEHTRNIIYRQHTASIFRNICGLFEIPVNENDTKLLLFDALTTLVTKMHQFYSKLGRSQDIGI
jgi:hypothetical protein